jgi:hypothetical protein
MSLCHSCNGDAAAGAHQLRDERGRRVEIGIQAAELNRVATCNRGVCNRSYALRIVVPRLLVLGWWMWSSLRYKSPWPGSFDLVVVSWKMS